MDYDGLSSPDSIQSDRVSRESFKEGARFVILWHSIPPLKLTKCELRRIERPSDSTKCRSSHFDLMLEESAHLCTFELPNLPIPGERFAIRRLPDHRLAYLEYEGPVSGNRGHVTRWTAGTYRTVLDSVDKWIIELNSSRLTARLVLIRPDSDSIENKDLWHLRASHWQLHPAKQL